MKIVYARNVNEAYTLGMRLLARDGVKESSRYGDVLVMPCPVTTVYTHPWERVLVNEARDANPFFHLMESLWMLAGRNDVALISEFSSKIGEFSDNGENFHAAYGHRWKSHFEVDQVAEIIKELKANPESRRAVIGMWDPKVDLNKEGKDFPCNLTIAFRLRALPNYAKRTLDVTVYNRSNDIIWGAYGANAVHMSILQEYIAACLEAKVGLYYQVSNNYHAYVNIFEKVGIPAPHPMDPYERGEYWISPLVEDSDRWMQDLTSFMNNEQSIYINNFFARVAEPMRHAWHYYKQKDYPGALAMVDEIVADDWRDVCRRWLARRMEKHNERIRTVAAD